MSYARPAPTAADATWLGAPAYTRPAQAAADASWASSGVTGTGAGTLSFTGAGAGAHGVAGSGAGTLGFTGAGEGEHTSPSVEGAGAGTLHFTGAGTGAHGVAGAGAGALAFTGAGTAGHGVAGAGAGVLGFAGSGAALHLRYEVRGEVRLGGVLVNRRVRCSKRATGELVGQADTVAGRYRVHAGFDDAEVYVTALDLAAGASDWIPPTANRLVPVLADDTA